MTALSQHTKSCLQVPQYGVCVCKLLNDVESASFSTCWSVNVLYLEGVVFVLPSACTTGMWQTSKL